MNTDNVLKFTRGKGLKLSSPLSSRGTKHTNAYDRLLEMSKATIRFDRESGRDAASRDLLCAQSMASQAHSMREALLELIELLFVDLCRCVEREGWTPKSVSKIEHLRQRCEALPIDREMEKILDLIDDYRAGAVQKDNNPITPITAGGGKLGEAE